MAAKITPQKDRKIVQAYQKGAMPSVIRQRFEISDRTIYRALRRQNVKPNRRPTGAAARPTDEGTMDRISRRIEEIHSILTTTQNSRPKSVHDDAQRRRIMISYNRGELLRHIAKKEGVYSSYVDRTLARLGVKRNRRSKKAA